MFGVPLRRPTLILTPMLRRCYSEGYSDRERWANMDEEERERVKKMRKLKRWQLPQTPVDHYMRAFDVGQVRGGIFSNAFSIKPTDWIAWYKRQQMDYVKWEQRYIPERQQTLGVDLALAHFLLHRNGKVRRKESNRLLQSDDIFSIPSKYEPTWFVEEIDASGTELCYEGLSNFQDLKRLKIAAFRNCKYFDDWCLERFVALIPSIEVLDVSDNRNITERGVEGLYRAWELKKLIVTDWGYGAALELTCLLLEDALPDLQVEIRKPSTKLEDEAEPTAAEIEQLQEKLQITAKEQNDRAVEK